MSSPPKTANPPSMHAAQAQGSISSDASRRGQDYSRTGKWCSHTKYRQTNCEPHHSLNLRAIVSSSEPLSGRRNKSESGYSYPSPHHEAMDSDGIPGRLLLPFWLAAAAMSLSSSLLVGAMLSSLSSHTGKGPGRSWSGSQFPLHDGQALCLEKTILSRSGLGIEALPPLPQTMCMSHIFCLSTLALHRSRKSDRYQNETIGILVLIGLSLGLCALPTEPCRDATGSAIMILPTLLSSSIIISAVHHILYVRWTARMGYAAEQEGSREAKR